MGFLRAFLTSVIILTLVAISYGLQDLTTVRIGGQLSGSTLKYVVNKGDDRAGGSDTVTMIYIVPKESWISIGFSNNGGSMVGSEAVVGLPRSGEVKKYSLTSIAQSGVVPMPEQQQTLIEPSIVQEEGTTVMQFTKILEEADEIQIMIGQNTFIGAFGFDNSFFMHEARGSFSVDLVDGIVETVETRKRTLWKAHGWCAALAWGIFSPIAIGAAILRKWLPNGLWLKIHQSLNSLVVLLTLGAFVFGVAAINEETPVDGNSRHFSPNPYPHRLIGLIVFTFVLFQSFSGQFRPHVPEKDEDKSCIRSSWEIIHRVLGISILAVSWYQVESGIKIYQALFVDSTTNLSAIFWGIVGAISGLITMGFAVIQIHGHKDINSDTNPNNEVKNSNEDFENDSDTNLNNEVKNSNEDSEND